MSAKLDVPVIKNTHNDNLLPLHILWDNNFSAYVLPKENEITKIDYVHIFGTLLKWIKLTNFLQFKSCLLPSKGLMVASYIMQCLAVHADFETISACCTIRVSQ